MSFQYFLKQFSALKFPFTATEYYMRVLKLCASAVRIKIMTVIDVKMGQNGRRSGSRSKSVLLGLESSCDLYRLQSL